MNCLEFRHACLTEPDSRDSEFRAHADACRACQAFLEEQRQMEERLRRALAIAPPAGLAARVMLKQSFAPRRWVPRLAVAATVLMAIAATSVTYLWNRPLSLEAEVLAHIHAEPEALAAPGPVDADKLAAVLRALGAQLDSAPGDDAMDGGGTSPGMGEVDRVGSERSRPRRELAVEVRYAGICDIRRRPGAHLVLAGERGPVTVLLMPDERVSQRAPLRTGNLEGVVLPVDGGSMAIVGSRGEPLNALEHRLRVQFHGKDV